MSTAEAMIEINSATEGMILSRSLLDAGGSVLLPEGASLTAASLASLRRRGIEQLPVMVEAEAADPAALQAERERQCARLAYLFRSSAETGATGVLLARLLDYRKGA